VLLSALSFPSSALFLFFLFPPEDEHAHVGRKLKWEGTSFREMVDELRASPFFSLPSFPVVLLWRPGWLQRCRQI